MCESCYYKNIITNTKFEFKYRNINVALINTVIVMIPADAITLAFTDSDNNNICHPTSIAYIQSILLPLFELIKATTTRRDLQRVIAKMPLNISNIVKEKMRLRRINTLVELSTNEEKKTTNLLEDPEILSSDKISILTYLVNEIASLVSKQSRNTNNDKHILPWDVYSAISNDPNFSILFGLTEKKAALPVTIMFDTKQYQHVLTEEFTMGLLLFSDPATTSVGKPLIKVVMFGIPFTSDFILYNEKSRNRFHETKNNVDYYRAYVSDQKYTFLSDEFIRGFTTGALWMNVDPHRYCKNLVKLKFDSSRQTHVEIPINYN